MYEKVNSFKEIIFLIAAGLNFLQVCSSGELDGYRVLIYCFIACDVSFLKINKLHKTMQLSFSGNFIHNCQTAKVIIILRSILRFMLLL